MQAISLSSGTSIQVDVPLQQYNTLAIPAKAAFLSRCTNLNQIRQCLSFAADKDLAPIVLGEGSNTVFAKDVDGLVILNRLTGIEVLKETEQSVVIKVAAGENWHDFVKYALEQSWFGLENLALIPGLVGAAPIQNIGAYGVEVKDAIESVEFIDIASLESRKLNQSECEFAYRDSIFKKDLRDCCIITSVTFRLTKLADSNISYPALANSVPQSASPLDVFEAVCEIRSSKLPMPDDLPNAGSFFKNPIVSASQHLELIERFSDLVSYPISGGGAKLAAGWMIDQRGWKSKSVQGVYMHREQALVLINPNMKSGQSVLHLAGEIQADIKCHFGVTLEIEPRVY